MARYVMKFGGTSLADHAAVDRAADQVASYYEAGHEVVAVVSAPAGETDALIADAAQYGSRDQNSTAALDLLLSTGELRSVARLCMALAARGIPADPFTGWRAGIFTTDAVGKARIQRIETERIRASLSASQVIVVAGFQGMGSGGQVTTLGRGGSDTTAVALAWALGAEECLIYTDVDGIYTADPRLEPQARRLDRLHCQEMLELAGLGSKVLATDSVEQAAKWQVPLRVLSSFRPDVGTRIVHQVPLQAVPPIAGIAASYREAELAVIGLPARRGMVAQLLAPLGEAHIRIDTIVQNEARESRIDVSFTLPRDELKIANRVLSPLAGQLGGQRLLANDHVGKVSLVGLGLRSNTELVARALKTLATLNITASIIVVNESRFSVVIPEEEVKRLVQGWHEDFKLKFA